MIIEGNPLNQYSRPREELRKVDHDWEELSRPNAISGRSIPLAEGVLRATSTTSSSKSSKEKASRDSQNKSTVPNAAKPTPPVSTAARLYSYLPTIDKRVWLDVMVSMTRLWLSYLLEVVDRAARLMKLPMTFFVFVWMMVFVTTKVKHVLLDALSPVCLLPGTASLQICHSEPLGPDGALKALRGADYPKIFDIQRKTFEHLIDQSASFGGSGLSLDIKKVEIASKDLVTLVKFSDMKSRDVIAGTMRVFIRDAQSTGRSLNKLNAKIGGAIDSIAAVSNYALRTIEEAQTNDPSTSGFSLKELIPWTTKPDTQAIIATAFTQTMEVLSNHLRRLIIEAEISHTNLEKLEENLSILHEIVAREDSSITSARAELLSDLWTNLLGRNRRQVQQHDDNLTLLRNVGKYRKKALALVVSSLHTLRELSEDIENLRERVAEPELIGSEVPVEVHIESIKAGLGRLQQGRVKSKEREDYVAKQIIGMDA